MQDPEVVKLYLGAIMFLYYGYLGFRFIELVIQQAETTWPSNIDHNEEQS